MSSGSDYEIVIGLEVHVQLATRSKLFCACRNEFGLPPNAAICPVCTAQPGALPVPNATAIELAMFAGFALDAEIASFTRFDRKNYFYPDLPKGYQITQLEHPIVGRGSLTIRTDDGAERTIRIVRAHLEEDAGKTIHPDGASTSLVDFNRAGVPLLEIVSAPDLRSPAEAHRYLAELKQRMRFARVSECDMEKGELRCDANVSLRPRGAAAYGTRVELKNLNSFKNVERALELEIGRQRGLLEAGKPVLQETRGYRAESDTTYSLRSKEEAEDYRYFPDPDLPALEISLDRIDALRTRMPETALAKGTRYRTALGLPEPVVSSLIQERDTALYFDRCVELTPPDPKAVANLLLSTVLGIVNERGEALAGSRITPRHLVDVVALIEGNRLSSQAARTKVLPAIAESGDPAAAVMAALGLEQVSDDSALEGMILSVIAANAKAVAEFRSGKAAALNSLVGAVMKASQGKANPNRVRELLTDRLRAP